ncbi:MAG: bifunctional phosphoribosylaminoimidazolecarboxamide formyltransferase/IMP cyclohydrolase PurH [Methanocalculus sp. MSAO_Arc1]|uniref:bifunctional phosphoribosylaminoimidazolecarboxamide formyltransferase/IMP cyclohydrolase n=1 Tax=Methanocalculus TaxID=71151 RepID=UPI000FF4488C|nr:MULTISPECIES: bifunctional phosphoribosylaminoimidazolecarboxamide formyltransferase/IMP cyclohydrolase [unclassified Methanocalculus]MCP1661987.1 phosphoribosylaminoimidazolecarboxamide formyltransferase/IMP cyclohydrolase [Methanocalculus sp. AMF5]RQD79893.1 MAG: bifunctional phosphoribosylaminoimidazolecarboxamide formyltransferase/IMP cyclohydrolase PurH [Methanocalculus sp. MSAO_Arc1]
MKTALLSVWDKTGIIDFARFLHEQGIALLSSGGTAKALSEASLPYTEVSQYTGSPEMMDGRVKTLHPKIHGGLLGRRGTDDAVMAEHGIEGIDILCVNLYPFEKMSAENLPIEDLVEFIDIGGPAMIRAAAKNYRDVCVVCDPADYPVITEAVTAGTITTTLRLRLAKKAFARTAAYDAAISNHLHSLDSVFPDVLTVQYQGGRILRYGENPHQQAAVYGTTGIAGSIPVQGKPMSYNNYLDLHAAVGLLREFDDAACVTVKHNNPCGVAIGSNLLEAYIRSRDVDPVSAYGAVVAMNRGVDSDVADAICSTFVEVVVAPSYTPEAREMMKAKENMRLLTLPPPILSDEIRSIDGGALLMRTPPYREHWEVVSEREPTAAELEAMRLAWRVCKHTKSNTIIFASNEETLGIGAGQMSRVDAAKIAIQKAGKPLEGSVVASDAFLPFPDTLLVAADAGATALIQPGGSIRDAEVIEAANQRNMAMVFTGVRYFRH